MLIDSWKESAFIEHVQLVRLGNASKWKTYGVRKWFIIKKQGFYPLQAPAQSLLSLAPACSDLGMAFDDFEYRVRWFVECHKLPCGFRCPDGLLVHPTAVALAVREMVRQKDKEEKRALKERVLGKKR